jgi:hypothetical protein
MEKAQLPLIAELDLGDTENFTAKISRKFLGTDDPRHLKLIHALLLRPREREEIGHIAGVSDGQEPITGLRQLGLAPPASARPASTAMAASPISTCMRSLPATATRSRRGTAEAQKIGRTR